MSDIKELNKRKQQFLNLNGIKVKIDGSWGPWLEELYRRLTTKDKHYNTTPLGFLSYVYDKTLGNGTTYLEDPAFVKGYSGEIKPDNRSSVRKYLDQQMLDNKTPLGFVTQTVLPSAAIAGTLVYGGPAITNGIRTSIFNPSTILPAAKNLVKEGIKGGVGATAVNAISKATTGKTWGELIAQLTGVSSSLGELTNPGFILGSPVYNISKNLSLILKKRSVISKVDKELKKGIKENSILESYNEVPANKDIGTVYDYLDFLDNIYPNSKLNATFYHGGPKGITQFKSAKELGSTNKGINSGTKDYGIYLADDKSLALYYAGTHKKANRHLYNVRVNVQNPMRYETNSFYMDKFTDSENLRFTPSQITLKWYDRLNLKNYDGIYHTKSKNAFEDGELVMLDGNNIHIMGTPEESLMFRTWKLNPLYSSKPLLEEISLTPTQYDRSFLNYAKAAKPGLFFTGLASTPLMVIGYDNYQKSKAANARKSKAANARKWNH